MQTCIDGICSYLKLVCGVGNMIVFTVSNVFCELVKCLMSSDVHFVFKLYSLAATTSSEGNIKLKI